MMVAFRNKNDFYILDVHVYFL